MKNIFIHPGNLPKKIICPSSKSHTLRAVLFASLARGTSYIRKALPSPDILAMIEACRVLGAEIEESDECLRITGRTSRILQATSIDVGNSGQVLRFVAAISALSGEYVELTGDDSIQTRRICVPLLDALIQRGAYATSINGNGHAPIAIRGPIAAGEIVIDGKDSQPVSAMMIACSLLPGKSTIRIQNAGETPWLDLTLDWLKRLGVRYEVSRWESISIWGQESFPSFDYSVPGDLSSCLFPLVAALCTQSDLVIENVDIDDVQGDKLAIEILQQMGAKLIIDRQQKTIAVKGPQVLQGLEIDINACIDALPILAVAGCFAQGRTTLYNGAIARWKESDRIWAMTQELKKMGAQVEEYTDGLCVTHSCLKGAQLHSHNDHRVALALAVAALGAEGESVIEEVACVKKSYSNFKEWVKYGEQ